MSTFRRKVLVASTAALFCLCLSPAFGQAGSTSQPQIQKQTGQGKINIPKSMPAGEKRMPPIDPSDSNSWKPSKASAKAILLKTDRWISQLHSASGQERFVFNTTFGYGFGNGELAVESPKHFIYSVTRMGGTLRAPQPQQYTTVSDGSKIQSKYSAIVTPAVQLGQSRLPKLKLDDWTFSYQLYVFGALGSSDHPLTALLAAAKAAGLSAHVENRTAKYPTGAVSQSRVLISGKAKSKGKPAKFTIEVLVDDATSAPITVRFHRNSVEGNYEAVWTIAWDLRPAQTFPSNLFKLFN